MKRVPVVAVALLLTVAVVNGGSEQAERKPASRASKGAAHYERLCASCHGSDGLARDGEAPPLAGSSWVSGPEGRLIRIVMHGVMGPMKIGDTVYDREMPGFGTRLSDEEIASLLSFVRKRWGGPAAAVTRRAVRRVRAASRNRARYWTVEELLALR